jgi:HlyD family secretion protein
LQATAGGQLKSLNIQGGQCVKKGDILATIQPIELQQRLQLARQKLLQLQAQAQTSTVLSEQRMQVERAAIASSQTSIQHRLQDTIALTPVLKVKGVDAIKEQRRSLQQRLQDAQYLVPVMEKRFEGRKALVDKGAISKDSLLQIEQEYIQARQSVADLKAQLKQLDVQSTEAERQYLENLRSVGDLQVQLRELNTRGKKLEQEDVEASNQRSLSIQEARREIIGLEDSIKNQSHILSAQDGCVTELTATVGQVVQPGLRLGSLRVNNNNSSMTSISFLPVKDGKQIKPGMTISITPDTVQRERFGGILGKITSVSSLPITRDGATAVIGNSEVATSLISGEGAVIQVDAKLVEDKSNISGYKWSSSKGPESKITPGTTNTVRVTVEERAPLTFVMPLLREFSGLK